MVGKEWDGDVTYDEYANARTTWSLKGTRLVQLRHGRLGVVRMLGKGVHGLFFAMDQGDASGFVTWVDDHAFERG
ncbi:MAG: hypothetical protein ACI9W2_003171 [Gammaproteobacteria bacterium]|jgi:hypothetical protein